MPSFQAPSGCCVHIFYALYSLDHARELSTSMGVAARYAGVCPGIEEGTATRENQPIRPLSSLSTSSTLKGFYFKHLSDLHVMRIGL